MPRHSPTLARCCDCGQTFVRKDLRVERCHTCFQKRRLKTTGSRSREANRQACKAYYYSRGFACTIEHDPDPDGGFRKGAMLSLMESAAMVANQSFTTGTIVRSVANGRLFEVTQSGKFKEVANV